MKELRIQYNAPVVLTFFFLSLGALALGKFTGERTTWLFFTVYRAPLTDPLTYLRMFTHVLGHADYTHFMSNMMLFLVVGPPLEEKYGSKRLLGCIALTALVSGLVQFIFFPATALLGASGIVFMLIVLSSLAGMRNGSIPLTLIVVAVLYLGGEVVDAVTAQDNISQLTHIVGGLCGAILCHEPPPPPPLRTKKPAGRWTCRFFIPGSGLKSPRWDRRGPGRRSCRRGWWTC